MSTRRIALIIATLDRAGAEKQLALLAGGLPRDEFDVHVLALTRGGAYEQPLRDDGIPVTVLGKRAKLDPLAMWQTRKWIQHLAPDLVHTWMFTANAYGRAAALSAGVKHLVAAERCADPWKSGPQLAIDRFLAKRTARIIANSSGVRDFYVGQGLPADKFAVIPNAIAQHAPSRRTRADVLAHLQLPSDSHLIAIVGRLWPQKRLKDAIWAAELLHFIREDVHLLVIGDGPQRDMLRRYSELVGVAKHVHFLGQRDDAADLVEHCDLLWLASGYEGQPNSVMEALAAGVPVVATNIPGVRDLVTSGEQGFLVPVGDRAGLARYANALIDDADLRARLGSAGRDRMAREFPLAAMIHRHAEVYRDVLQ